MPSPYKDKELLIDEIKLFVNSHNAYLANHSKRISDYFEMICYNNTVKFYKKNRYKVAIKNLDSENNFVYKLQPTGIPSNFSYFQVIKRYYSRVFSFEIHHNLAIESAWQENIYFTPDVAVIQSNTIKSKTGFYKNSNRFSYCENKSLQTFIEAKHLNPFPELLFSFCGLVLEMMNEAIQGGDFEKMPIHISPSLVLSGNGNRHTKRIRDSLMKRYNVNIIFGLFFNPTQMHSSDVCKIGTRKI